MISFTGAILFSTKAILVKLAFRSTHADALTLLALRMLLSLPFYLAMAFWGSRQKGNARMNRGQWGWVIALGLTYTGIGIAYFGELKIDIGNPNFYWGSFLVFLCSITYAIYLSGAGRLIPLVGAAKFTTYSMLTATLGVLAHFFIRQVSGDHSPLPTGMGSGTVWGYGIALALVATVIPSFMRMGAAMPAGPDSDIAGSPAGPAAAE